MIKRMTKYVMLAVFGIVCSSSVASAKESQTQPVKPFDSNGHIITSDVDFDIDFREFSRRNDEKKAISNSRDTTPDQYETNDTMATATDGLKGSLVTANLHNDTDFDWYQFSLTQEEIDNDEYYSIILDNIPSGLNYKLYLVNPYYQGMEITAESSSATSKEFYFQASDLTQNTYYILVRPDVSVANTDYKLYFGLTYKYRGYGWTYSGLTFNFPNRPSGQSGYVTSTTGQQVLNLTNVSTIPPYSIVKYFYMDADGTGTWGGFYKILKGYSLQTGQTETFEQSGLIDLFSGIDQKECLVKQQWVLDGKINFASSFVWKPNIFIHYKWPVTLQNLSWL